MIRGGQVYAMTETHSVVMEQVRNGLLTLEQARQHDERNVILRSLGSRPEVEPSVWQSSLPVCGGDSFVLCSDGLYDVVEDEEIRAAVEASNPFSACEDLIQLALSRGAPDNVTAVVVSIREEVSPRNVPVPQTREAEALT
jgi:serine/threonine protein phosphatase PrpC